MLKAIPKVGGRSPPNTLREENHRRGMGTNRLGQGEILSGFVGLLVTLTIDIKTKKRDKRRGEGNKEKKIRTALPKRAMTGFQWPIFVDTARVGLRQ